MKVLVFTGVVEKDKQSEFTKKVIKEINAENEHSVRFGNNLASSKEICARVKDKIPHAIIFSGHSKPMIEEVIKAVKKDCPGKKINFFAKDFIGKVDGVKNITSYGEAVGLPPKKAEKKVPEKEVVDEEALIPA
jgi:hypothetical protein